MEFAVFAARVDILRQRVQKRGVEITSGEGTVELARIHAGQFCFDAGGDHVLRQGSGRKLPERKEGFEAGAGKLVFPVGADIAQEQVSERYRINSLSAGPSPDSAQEVLIVRVRAGP